MFADAARIQLPWAGDPTLKITENFFLQGPDWEYFDPAPSTHFRHPSDIAIVGFLDGHVDSRTWVSTGLYPKSWDQAAIDVALKNKVDYLNSRDKFHDIQGIRYN